MQCDNEQCPKDRKERLKTNRIVPCREAMGAGSAEPQETHTHTHTHIHIIHIAQWYSDWLRAGLLGDGISLGRDFPNLSRPVVGPNQPLTQWVPGYSRNKTAGAWC